MLQWYSKLSNNLQTLKLIGEYNERTNKRTTSNR